MSSRTSTTATTSSRCKTAHDNIATQQATVDRIGKQVTAAAGRRRPGAGAARLRARPARRAPSSSSSASATSRHAAMRASRRSSRRRPTATRRLPPCSPGRQRSKRRKPRLDVLKAQQVEALRTLDQFKTALAKAERDLSFTVVRAPFDGVIGNRAMQVGDLVQPGAAAREPGAARCGLCRRELQGDAARGSASGPAGRRSRSTPTRPQAARPCRRASRRRPAPVFSLLPPDNATGNFTKIVQRLPVRIAVPAEVAEQGCCAPACRWSSASTPSRALSSRTRAM